MRRRVAVRTALITATFVVSLTLATYPLNHRRFRAGVPPSHRIPPRPGLGAGPPASLSGPAARGHAAAPARAQPGRPGGARPTIASQPQRISKPREEEDFDQPNQAAVFDAMQRVPPGSNRVPVERYFAGQIHNRSMPRYSSALRRRFPPRTAAPAADLTDVLSRWNFLGPGNVGGRVRSLAIDPDHPTVMYAGAATGGVWKSTNGGASWFEVGDLLQNLEVSSLAMDPNDPTSQTIYAATGESQNNALITYGGGIFKSTDGGATWNVLDSTRLPSDPVCPSQSTSSPGCYSPDDFHFIAKLIVAPGFPQHLYAATSTGLFRSLDGGAHWASFLSGLNCWDLAARTDKGTDYLFAACGVGPPAGQTNGSEGSIFRNPDAGGAGTWIPVLDELNMSTTSLAIAPSSQDIVYAMSSMEVCVPDPSQNLSCSDAENKANYQLLAVYRSTSSGDPGTWDTQVSNTDPTNLNLDTVLLSNTRDAFNSICNSGQASTYHNQGYYDNVLAVDPVNPSTVWAGGIDLFRSDDGGKTWGLASYWWSSAVAHPDTNAIVSPHADQHAIVFPSRTDDSVMYVGNDGGVYKTTNSLAPVAASESGTCNPVNSSVTWTNQNNFLGITQFYNGVVYPDGQTYLGGSQDNGTIQGGSAAGENAWTIVDGGDGGYVAVNPLNTQILYSETPHGALDRSADGGASFAESTTGITGDPGDFLFITPFEMDQKNPQRLWLGGKYLWTTSDGAQTWHQASNDLSGAHGDARISAIAISPGDSNLVALGDSDGNIWINGMAPTLNYNWTKPQQPPRAGYVSWIAFDPADQSKQTIYATYSSFKSTSSDAHVYRSTDLGQHWTAIDGSGASGLPDVPVLSLVVDPNVPSQLYIATDLGVYTTVDGGRSWNLEITKFAEARTQTLRFLTVDGNNLLFAFTHGRGVWSTSVTYPPIDLAITQTNAGNFRQGSNASLAITVTNVGGQATGGTVTVTDLGSFNAASMSGDGWSCVQPAGPCTRNDVLVPGDSYPQIVLAGTIPHDAGSSVSNTVAVSIGGDVNVSNDFATDTVAIDLGASLMVGIIVGGVPGVEGDGSDPYGFPIEPGRLALPFLIQPQNYGAGATIGGITVSVDVPAGLTPTSISGFGIYGSTWNCAQPAGPCTSTAVMPAYPLGAALLVLYCNVDNNAPSNMTIDATVSGGGIDDPPFFQAAYPLTTGPLPDLTIASTHTGNFTQGQAGATYSILVTNSGHAATLPSHPMNVADTVPFGLTPTAIGGDGWTCDPVYLAALSCQRYDSLAAGASYPPLTVTVNVAGDAPASVTNSAAVSYGLLEFSTDHKTSSDPTTIVPPPDLTVTSAHTGSFTQAQTGATYTITATNAGGSATSGLVTVTDTVPSGLTARSIAGDSWNCTQPAGPCTRSDALSASASYPAITLTVDVAADAPATVFNLVKVSGGGETNSNNDTNIDATSIIPLPILTIAKTHAGNFTQGEQGVTYTVTISNMAGAGPTNGLVTMTEMAPTGITLVGMAGGPTWDCTAPPVCTTNSALAAGSGYPAIAVTGNVAPDAPGTLINRVSVSGGGAAIANGSDTATIIPLPLLSIVKSHTGNFKQGQSGAAYSVTVTNAAGAGPTSGMVTVTETVPVGLTLVSMAGGGWTCPNPGNTCMRGTSLAGGLSYPAITVTVDVADNAAAQVTNQVSVSGGGSGIARGTDITAISPGVPALSIAKTHVGNFTQGQNGAAYSIVVSNSTGATATSGTVTVTETVPTGLTLVSMAGTGWDCPNGGNTCTRGDPLAAGSSYSPIVATVNVADDAAAQVTNQASVSGGSAAAASAQDLTVVLPFVGSSRCDLNQDGAQDVVDVQAIINEAQGATAASHNLTQDGSVNVAAVQIIVNATLGLGCGAT